MNFLKGFKTVIGAVLAAAPTLLPVFGLTVSGEELAFISSTVDAVITAAGMVLALFGRFDADTPIFRSE